MEFIYVWPVADTFHLPSISPIFRDYYDLTQTIVTVYPSRRKIWLYTKFMWILFSTTRKF